MPNPPNAPLSAMLDPRLAGTAAFLRPQAAGETIANAPAETLGGGTVAADVMSDKPNEIQIRQPSLVDAPMMTHELAHSRQFGMDPSVTFPADPAGRDLYNYGGESGLLNAQQQHRTIANYGREQQARIIEDFQRQTQQAMKTGDAAALDRANQAYEPLARQFSQLPMRGEQMNTIDTHPRAPGPPPASVAGSIMSPSQLIGGSVGLPRTTRGSIHAKL